MLLIVIQPELLPSVEFFEEDPQTPTLNTINVADAYDWQQRAHDFEQQLSVLGTKFERERRLNRRLQSQINEYIDALGRSTQNCSQVIHQCQLVSNTSLVISENLRVAKLTIETLEAVIVLLYTSSKDWNSRAGSKGEESDN